MKKPTRLQWSFFYQRLHHLLVAGVPLVDAIHLLGQYTADPLLADLCVYLNHCVLHGQSLAAAAEASQYFDGIDVSLLAAGELSGRLAGSVLLLAKHHQRHQQFKHGLQQAMAYPLAVVMLSALVLWGMLVWLVPQFSQLFVNFGAPLPWLTRLLLTVAHQAMWLSSVSLLLLILLIGVMRYLWRHQRGSVECYGFRLWFWGDLWRLSVWQRFCQTLGLMLSAGVPLLPALAVSGKASASVLCCLC
jgi:type IV pilus assembly protein PilC